MALSPEQVTLGQRAIRRAIEHIVDALVAAYRGATCKIAVPADAELPPRWRELIVKTFGAVGWLVEQANEQEFYFTSADQTRTYPWIGQWED